jgi:hypothetical protein
MLNHGRLFNEPTLKIKTWGIQEGLSDSKLKEAPLKLSTRKTEKNAYKFLHKNRY